MYHSASISGAGDIGSRRHLRTPISTVVFGHWFGQSFGTSGQQTLNVLVVTPCHGSGPYDKIMIIL